MRIRLPDSLVPIYTGSRDRETPLCLPVRDVDTGPHYFFVDTVEGHFAALPT